MLDKPTTVETLALPPLEIRRLDLVIIGSSPMLVHRWSDKIKKQMADKQAGKASPGRDKRNPKKEFEEAQYRLENGGHGFPSVGFKAAMITAITSVSGMTKVAGRQSFHIEGDIVQIHGPEPTLREDMVRVGNGSADIRYRPEYADWWAVLPITYNSKVISPEQLMQLAELGGFGVGVGDWRPGKGGSSGRWRVANSEEGDKLLASLKA